MDLTHLQGIGLPLIGPSCSSKGNATAGNDADAPPASLKQDYGKSSYWDARMQEQEGTFDWYATYEELENVFLQYCPPQKKPHVLMVGCGNSALSSEMHANGFRNMTNIDISRVSIEKMEVRFKSLGFRWLEMDATAMTFDDCSFDVAIDKGTVDALMSPGLLAETQAVMTEVWRTLRPGGIFILVSHNAKRRAVLEQALADRFGSSGVWEYLERRKTRLSAQATLINVLRSKLNGQPLMSAFKDPVMMAEAGEETKKHLKMMQFQEVFQMFKAKKAAAARANGAAPEEWDEDESAGSPNADPRLQPFCWAYILRRPG